MLSRKSPIPTPHPPCPAPPPTPTSWPCHSPVLGHIKFARQRGLSSNDGRLGHLLLLIAVKDMSSGGTG